MSVYLVDPFPSYQLFLLASKLSSILGVKLKIIAPSKIYYLIYPSATIVRGIESEGNRSVLDMLREGGNIILSYGDSRPLIKNILSEVGIFDCNVFLFFERGFVRRYYCQCSSTGVNSRASILKNGVGDFSYDLSMYQIEESDANSDPQNSILFLKKTLYNFLCLIVLVYVKMIKSKSFYGKTSLWVYFRRHFPYFKPSHSYLSFNLQSKENMNVLVGLQLESDEQFRSAGLFQNNLEFLSLLRTISSRLDVGIVCKIHPNDVDFPFKECINLGWSIENSSPVKSELFLTINSTLGFELAGQGWSIATLVRCWYTDVARIPNFEGNIGLAISSLVGGEIVAEGIDVSLLLSGSLPGDLLEFDHNRAEVSALIIAEWLSNREELSLWKK